MPGYSPDLASRGQGFCGSQFCWSSAMRPAWSVGGQADARPASSTRRVIWPFEVFLLALARSRRQLRERPPRSAPGQPVARGLVSSRQPPRCPRNAPGRALQRAWLARLGRHVVRSQAHTPARSVNRPHRVARASVDSTARPGANGATTAAATGRGRRRSRPRRRHTSGSTGTPEPPPAGRTRRPPGLPPERPLEAHMPRTGPRQSSAHYRA